LSLDSGVKSSNVIVSSDVIIYSPVIEEASLFTLRPNHNKTKFFDQTLEYLSPEKVVVVKGIEENFAKGKLKDELSTNFLLTNKPFGNFY
jgi:hypothetical protein